MGKSILLAATFAALVAAPAFAQGAWDSATTGDQQGNFTYKSKLMYKPVAPSAETLNDQSGDNSSGWGDAQQTKNDTHQQGFRNGDPVNGPHMRPLGFEYGARSGAMSPLSGGGSGATQGGPIIMFGQNTFLAPGNLALQTQNHSMVGGKLPPTHLDSFVTQSGYSFSTYGDVGTYGPPKLTNFSYINSGIQGNLTTGHPSDAPSAWGTPLKYNSAGGVIQGQ